ncbi:MAG: cell division protein SepF [Acidimicrobiales bacterium]
MSGFVKKAVVWLGLNEEYPEGERMAPASTAPSRTPRPAVEPGPAARPAQTHRAEATRPVRPVTESAPTRTVEPTVRAIPMEEPARSQPLIGTVRPVSAPSNTKPQVIIPKSFNDAQIVADHFKDSTPVIVNMQNAERDLARRLIDFSSGLCYGLGGQMERVAEQVYLLTPDEVTVSDEERERFSE